MRWWPFKRSKSATVDELRAFFRAGGVLRLADWVQMDDEAIYSERVLALLAGIHGEVAHLAAMADPKAAVHSRLESKLNGALGGERIKHG